LIDTISWMAIIISIHELIGISITLPGQDVETYKKTTTKIANLKKFHKNDIAPNWYTYIDSFSFQIKLVSFPLLDNYRRSFRTFMVHIHWASHARNQWSHARLQFFFLMQGFTAVFFHHIVIVSDINYHNMVKKILYTYVYHVVYYPGRCEALHEITDEITQCMCTISRHQHSANSIKFFQTLTKPL